MVLLGYSCSLTNMKELKETIVCYLQDDERQETMKSCAWDIASLWNSIDRVIFAGAFALFVICLAYHNDS